MTFRIHIIFLMVINLSALSLSGQRSEVYFHPLPDGPLAPLAKELASRLKEELARSGLALTYSSEIISGPVDNSFRNVLRESARKQNLAFLLLQTVAPGEPDTIRHDLYSTFDGRLLSSVLVKGDSGRSALLRPALLAREIALQLRALPPVSITSQPSGPSAGEIPLLQPQVVVDSGPVALMKLGGGINPLQHTSYGANLEILWLSEGRSFYSAAGVAGGYQSGLIQGSLNQLPWDFPFLKIRGEWGWNAHSMVKLSLGSGVGTGILRSFPEGTAPKLKLLPTLDLRAGSDLLFGRNFRLGISGELSLVANPGWLLWVPSAVISLGWRT